MRNRYNTKAFGELRSSLSLFKFEKDTRCALYTSTNDNYRYIGVDTAIVTNDEIMIVQIDEDYILLDLLTNKISLVNAMRTYDLKTIFITKKKDPYAPAMRTKDMGPVKYTHWVESELYTDFYTIPKENLPQEAFMVGDNFTKESKGNYLTGEKNGMDITWTLAKKFFGKDSPYSVEDVCKMLGKEDVIDYFNAGVSMVDELVDAIFSYSPEELVKIVNNFEAKKAEEELKNKDFYWIKHLGIYKCSKCDFKLSTHYIEEYNYCPACGTKKIGVKDKDRKYSYVNTNMEV